MIFWGAGKQIYYHDIFLCALAIAQFEMIWHSNISKITIISEHHFWLWEERKNMFLSIKIQEVRQDDWRMDSSNINKMTCPCLVSSAFILIELPWIENSRIISLKQYDIFGSPYSKGTPRMYFLKKRMCLWKHV